ncbi:MAG: pseudouridine synthase [Candidatus Pacebacteria bacterium CG_4_10_14_0_8_um_filter_42_14]|nr:MAG: pseudouridine synthase [Candidatus Pacebacteria bacterium CG_4_10_14_0_8_um_filter_42_14]
MESSKLQQVIAHKGIASRRKAEELIRAGKVSVNGKTAHIGQRVILGEDIISVNGEKIDKPENLRYFLVYKPVGYVSTTSDELGRKTVLKLLPTKVTERLYPVGRLDKDSEGLMLLSNDGELANKLTHPSFGIQKTYEATVKGKVSYKALQHLRRGVRISEGYVSPRSAKLLEKDPDQSIIQISLSEGKKHQVRRMVARIGYDVIKLVRTALGPFKLEHLAGKPLKEITKEEILAISKLDSSDLTT